MTLGKAIIYFKHYVITWLAFFATAKALVGGQAVIEGIMMRNGASYSLALRLHDGKIYAKRLRWFSLVSSEGILSKPFLRGFPLLLETLINGIKALNLSAANLAECEHDPLENWHIAIMLFSSLALAMVLFVILPHTLSIVMQNYGLAGNLSELTFHLWDGLFKFTIFILYIRLIAYLPDIKRVFQYHGAEHKVIHAYEKGQIVDLKLASQMSRLHPRCGTTFLLFVIALSIVVHALLVPFLMEDLVQTNPAMSHVIALLIKIALILPISALAYEIVFQAARMSDGIFAKILRMPGLMLQSLTTAEPDEKQLQVALVALRAALDTDQKIITVPYTLEYDFRNSKPCRDTEII